MPMMKTSSKQIIPGKKYSSSLSLCLSCTLAYGYLCFAVPFADRDWIMAYEERVYAGSHAPYTICSVVKCRRCLLYTSDAADDLLCVDLCGRRIINKKNNNTHTK